jgi:hypothetical protein
VHDNSSPADARATVLLLMMRLHDSVNSVGTDSLSMADANRNILMVDS